MPRKKYDNYMTESISNSEKETESYEEENTEESPAKEETRDPKTKNGIICNTIYVNVRSAPNLEADVVRLMREGEKVKIVSKVNGFCEVFIDVDKTGYIDANYVQEE